MLTSRKQTTDYQSRIIRELEALPDIPLCLFNEFDDLVIKKHYARLGAEPIAKVLNKTRKQITERASRLGIRRI